MSGSLSTLYSRVRVSEQLAVPACLQKAVDPDPSWRVLLQNSAVNLDTHLPMCARSPASRGTRSAKSTGNPRALSATEWALHFKLTSAPISSPGSCPVVNACESDLAADYKGTGAKPVHGRFPAGIPTYSQQRFQAIVAVKP